MANPYEEPEYPNDLPSPEERIERALEQLDGVMLTPEQAQEALRFKLWMLEQMDLEPDEYVTDIEFTLAEIGRSSEPQSLGQVYRKHHISSLGQPLIEGLREQSLVGDFVYNGIWHEISFYRNPPKGIKPAEF